LRSAVPCKALVEDCRRVATPAGAYA